NRYSYYRQLRVSRDGATGMMYLHSEEFSFVGFHYYYEQANIKEAFLNFDSGTTISTNQGNVPLSSSFEPYRGISSGVVWLRDDGKAFQEVQYLMNVPGFNRLGEHGAGVFFGISQGNTFLDLNVDGDLLAYMADRPTVSCTNFTQTPFYNGTGQ